VPSSARDQPGPAGHPGHVGLVFLASLARNHRVAKNWQLQEAKNAFSTVVEKALTEGHQVVTRHGRPAVVVMSVEEFRRLKPRADSLVDFLGASPLRALPELPPRARDTPRRSRL
jgi:antitoxin Phd